MTTQATPTQCQDAMRLIQSARQAITDDRQRQVINALFTGMVLRLEPETGVASLAKIPAPLRKLPLLHCAAAGDPPAPAVAIYIRSQVAAWGELGDDEAALAVWAGVAPAAVGMGQGAAGQLDAYSIASRVLAWGVPEDFEAACSWIDAHVDGLAADAAAGRLIRSRKPLPPGAATERVAMISDPAIRLEALVQVATKTRADAEYGARWTKLASDALASLGPAAPNALQQAAAVAAVLAPEQAKTWLSEGVAASAGLPIETRAIRARWAALAAARLGFETWKAEVEGFFADRAWYGLKDKREALAVDVLGVVEEVTDLVVHVDAAQNVIREPLHHLKIPIWRAVALSLLLPLSARTPGRHPAALMMEIGPELMAVYEDVDTAGAYLPDIIKRAADAEPIIGLGLCRAIPTPTLQAFAAIHLYERFVSCPSSS